MTRFQSSTRTALVVVATWPVGAEPSGVVEDRAGKRLFVANRISNDVAVLDAQTGAEEKRLMAGRGTSYLTLSPDGSRIYVTHVYPNPSPLRTGLENRTAPESEITVIDAQRAVVVDRIPLHSIAGVFHVALSADGRLGAVAEYHPKNLIPLAHLEHGGAFAYTLTIFGADVGKPVEIPLDELDRYASQPFGVAIAPGQVADLRDASAVRSACSQSTYRGCCTSSHSHPRPASGSFASDLSASANYVVARIPVGHNPRGLALGGDGRRLFVANRLDDTISVIDTRHPSRCLNHHAGWAEGDQRPAPRRANLLYSTLFVPGPDRLLQLPYRFHLRWPAVEPGAGRIWPQHCRQQAARGHQGH